MFLSIYDVEHGIEFSKYRTTSFIRKVAPISSLTGLGFILFWFSTNMSFLTGLVDYICSMAFIFRRQAPLKCFSRSITWRMVSKTLTNEFSKYRAVRHPSFESCAYFIFNGIRFYFTLDFYQYVIPNGMVHTHIPTGIFLERQPL